jgi:hypothetical protein
LQWPDKDPGDVLDYDADFSDALPSGDDIATVVWVISPVTSSPLKKDSQTHDDPTQTATIWLSGGLVDTDYTVNVTLTTVAGRVIERDIGLNCRNLL